MYNFMGCDQMMFGPLVRNGITYKSNEQGFLVWKRKYYHNFKCQISTKSYENVECCQLKSIMGLIVGNHQTIEIWDDHDFTMI